jgi:DNA-binding MarR family transcriptional regulator
VPKTTPRDRPMPDRVSEYVDALESLILGFSHGTRGVLRKKNLTAVQFLVLQWATAEAPASMTALATFLGVRPQSVTPVIDSLVERGWIRRRRSGQDRRQTLLELTPEAILLMRAFRRAHVSRLKRTLRQVPDRSLAQATSVLRVTERTFQESLDLSGAERRLRLR